ncbi:MAG: Uncharacterized protein Athens101410_226 [Parcubacteria group bacterium Athens1014_10]|nr:MAG: Uncharacterized protein Athens101410_226 [Parcubacteria group bacterium Athens1014_10]TSD04758.1 MAG: Uncharacterized protein Athens071412_633 [Parcubacteria group bacterium Athens0714_12]
MKNNRLLEKSIKIIRFVFVFSVLSVISWLFYKDFVPSGVLEIKNTFKSKSVLISALYPENRLRKIEEQGGIYFQTMRIDPIYFDLTIPRFFKTAKVIIKYQNPSRNLFQIGLKNVDSDWDFLFKTLEDKEKGIALIEKDGWRTAEADFELQSWLIKDRELYFILSSPLLYDKQAEIKISEIKIILEKEPWTAENFLPRFKNYLKNN